MRVNPLTINEPLFRLPGGDSQILMLSLRKAADLVGYTALYEFEDLVAGLTGAELGQVNNFDSMLVGRRIYHFLKQASGSHELASTLTPRLGQIQLTRDYDLFLPMFNHPDEVFTLSAVKNWRKRCRFAACYLSEAWISELPRYPLELLREFDHIFVGLQGVVESLMEITGRPCSYLPRAVDTLLFSPYPNPARRGLDVANIGRRSAVTHARLLEMSHRDNLFYYYDTAQVSFRIGSSISFRVTNPREHRWLLASLLKRARYFMASRAFADRPGLTAGQEEIPGRFYEGAAAGTIMLGEPPDCETFRDQFGWKDSIINAPYDNPEIASLIAELDRDTARTTQIRKRNVSNSLLRHDWAYRLRTILETAGIAIPQRLLAREEQLASLAQSVIDAPE
jgi:hypothetical protein